MISTVFALVIGVEINGEVWESVPHVYDSLSECVAAEQQYSSSVVWAGCYKAEVGSDGKIIKFN